MGIGSSKPSTPPDPKKPEKPKKKEKKEEITDEQLIKSGFGTKPGNDKK